MERGRGFSFILLASLALATAAAAQSNSVCDDLRGRLANVSETISTGREARRTSDATGDQNSAIGMIENELNDRGCHNQGSTTLIGPEDAAVCDQLQSSLARMQENLRYLLARQAETSEEGAERSQLQAALRENGCDAPVDDDTEIVGNREEPLTTPEQQAMRTDTFYPPMGEEETVAPAISPYAGGAGMQTVCVRTCDGGFFPMTANATPLNFQADANTCARMCPDVSTELFYRYLPGQESSDMVSAANGLRYSAMPYAFAYRKRKPGEKSACSCNLPAYYEEMRRDKAASAPDTGTSPSSIITIETAKPKPPAASASTTPAVPAPERPYDPSNKVRRVGPQFLGSDLGAIDLHPAVPGPQPQQ
ncbi:DUF2865 domain-containing protein [Rhizobium sp. RAF56]